MHLPAVCGSAALTITPAPPPSSPPVVLWHPALPPFSPSPCLPRVPLLPGRRHVGGLVGAAAAAGGVDRPVGDAAPLGLPPTGGRHGRPRRCREQRCRRRCGRPQLDPSLAQRLAYARTAARLMRVDREFTPADYEALLELDAFGGAVPRGATKEVVDRLPVKVVGDEEEGSSSASTAGGSSSRADASRPTAGRDDRRRPAATGARRGSVYGLPRGDEPRPASYGARLWPRHATGDVAPVVGRSRRVAPCAKGCVGDSGLKVE
eukprot:TRINITY_DN812_c0_g1_i7.p2 TRINITY_DN812_c0_g1~~TRINITY_DN812_c0_g1_i7.p2  ORF type:complete len:263 (-),score=40.77 TRINITY_DN812_c0_g1_i7:170-958(-)